MVGFSPSSDLRVVSEEELACIDANEAQHRVLPWGYASFRKGYEFR